MEGTGIDRGRYGQGGNDRSGEGEYGGGGEGEQRR
jgi:hypothetical protein